MTFTVTRSAIDDAAARIGTLVRRTPVIDVDVPSPGGALEVALKLELLQHTGSFKPRGAFNRVLSNEVHPVGLIAASGGNHGLAVAHVAHELGHRAEIFVPTSTPPAKLERLHAFGGEVDVRVVGDLYADAQEASTLRAVDTGALVVHPYDQPEVVAGQGTMSRELDSQVDALDAVLIAVGGGGLIAGASSWFGDRAQIVGVEPETSRALGAALEMGHPVDVAVSGVAADSLGARRVGDIAFAAASGADVHPISVTDDAIVAAQRWLWQEVRVIAEPGGATALAAVLSGAWVPPSGHRVAVVVCGSNTDPASVAVG